MTGKGALRTHLDDAQRRDWLRLMRSENVGPITFKRLLNRYGSARKALEMLPDLSARGGLPRPVQIASVEQAEQECDTLARLGGALVCAGEPGYPPLLAQIDDAPPLLTVQGHRPAAHKPCIGIVGSRNASAGGLKIARMIASDLVDAGMVVVSGLARGIDRAAHEAALEAGTLAVLAGGLSHIYPAENRPLAHEIVSNGLLLTEMAVDHTPRGQDFPRRNRIISGCCHGVIVIEAAKRSGSLITARLAAEQNRDVFAVPGAVLDPRSEGTNNLIRRGATLVTSADHVLEALAPQIESSALSPPGPTTMNETLGPKPEPPEDPELGARLLSLLSTAPIDFDTLVREAGAQAGEAAGALLELELAGRISWLPGNRLALRV